MGRLQTSFVELGGVAQRRVVCLLCGKLCVGALVPKKSTVSYGGCVSMGSHRPDWKEEASVWGAGAGETGT